jgi:CheY-like chemotaxis protein
MTEIITKPAETTKRVLLVDDEPDFTNLLKAFLQARQTGSWVVHTAEEYSSALAVLKKNKVDLVVLDLTLPVMDGSQVLKVLKGTYPELPVIILTAQATPENRANCLANGAALFLDKASVADGFDAIYPALEAVATTATGGFRGVLRQVEIPDILQLECLGRKSSVLEIKAPNGSGRIFIKDGSIIHAESGSVLGERALFQLLGLNGGEFQLKTFRDPGRVTIEGNWESLLMEAARLRDEASGAPQAAPAPAPGIDEVPEVPRTLEEVILCAGTGEVLYEWQCEEVERRVRLIELLGKRSELFSRLVPLGLPDRLEIEGATSRTIAVLQAERKIFVRLALKSAEPDGNSNSEDSNHG